MRPLRVRRGVGECAGDIVEPVDLLLADADERAEATAVASTSHYRRVKLFRELK